jgi:NAD(P)-dependent dehydrogenase (short-subunit alcohol dehydrogenase family)
MMRFKDKLVVITGAGTGIGRAIANRFAEEGAVLAIGDLNEQTAQDTCESIRTSSPNSKYYQVDVTKEEQMKYFSSQVVKDLGQPDILISNAGVSSMAPLTDLSVEDWDFNMNVNAKGTWLFLKHFAPLCIDRKKGRIVLLASMAAKLGAPLLAHYSASKFAVIGLAQAAAKEFAPYNITVNAVCPGFVKTGMQDREVIWEAKLRGIENPEDVRKEYVDMTPLKRLCEAEDVANVVSFLASEDASFMTGQALNVTGGVCVH